MGDSLESFPTSEPLDLETIRSGVKELSDVLKNSREESVLSSSDTEQLLKDCTLHLEGRINQIVSEYSDAGFLDVEYSGNFVNEDAYLKFLNEELKAVEADSARVSDEIEVLSRASLGKSNQLESNIERLQHSLDSIELQGTGKASTPKDNHMRSMNLIDDKKLEVLKLSHQLEENKRTLKSMLDLESELNRLEAVEKVEDALTGLKVIEFEGNSIRLTLRTYIPEFELEQKINDVIIPPEVNHEMLIEVMNGTMELKKAEIFPNDVCIGEIVDAAKSFRTMFSHLSLPEPRSSLEWFISKVQDRIILCTLRRHVVKAANNLRHSFEYLDRDEMIAAHLAGGIDAIMKLPQSWPILNSALSLVSLKSSDFQSKSISLNVFCKVQEMANSLDSQLRQNLSGFVVAIEEILVQQMRCDSHTRCL